MNTHSHPAPGGRADPANPSDVPREGAVDAVATVLARALPRELLRRLDAGRMPGGESDRVLRLVVFNGAVGMGMGAVIGALAMGLLFAADTALLSASPWLAMLAMVGWGASLGATVGAIVGAADRRSDPAPG